MGSSMYNQHRARNLPDVDFGKDGQILVSDNQGTFPLRSKPKELGDKNLTISGIEDVYGSNRPRRYRKRKPLPSQYAAEVAAIAGAISNATGNSTTIASGTSSLGRKVRRTKQKRFDLIRAFDSVRSSQSFDAADLDYNSLGRSFSDKKLDFDDFRQLQIEALNYQYQYDEQAKQQHIQLPYIPGSKVRPKKRTNEEVPFILFLLVGIILLILGLARLLIGWWHEYGCALWTGTVVSQLNLYLFVLIHLPAHIGYLRRNMTSCVTVCKMWNILWKIFIVAVLSSLSSLPCAT